MLYEDICLTALQEPPYDIDDTNILTQNLRGFQYF